MAKIVCFGGLKGGSGKSTLAVCVGAALVERKKSVALVDTDSQATASKWASHGLLPFDTLSMVLESARGAQKWLSSILLLGTDYVLVDLPPHLRVVTDTAVALADVVCLPVTASGADIDATVEAVELVREVRAERDGVKPACLLVPNRVDVRTLAGRELPDALKALGEKVALCIGYRIVFVDAYNVGLAVTDYAPHSVAAEEIRVLAQKVMRL